MKANQRIRDAANQKGVFLYQVAERFGCKYPQNFSQKMRKEFSAEDQERALRYIEEIAEEREQT